MKAYVTTIGETTTDICAEKLKELGFEVIVIGGVEPWREKYKKFVKMAYEAGERCVRIDADIIPNKNTARLLDYPMEGLMTQFKVYGFYAQNMVVGGPVLYEPHALRIINFRFKELEEDRPETSASRLPELNPYLETSSLVCGLHGFFQDRKTMERAMKHKIERKQLDEKDLQFAFEIADRFFLKEDKEVKTNVPA